ncbi:hypothetical protein WG66_010397 [Moniliophthora roreri]|nr:hypothetical protein WG66_010397 [Moniliophthora roreri]
MRELGVRGNASRVLIYHVLKASMPTDQIPSQYGHPGFQANSAPYLSIQFMVNEELYSDGARKSQNGNGIYGLSGGIAIT